MKGDFTRISFDREKQFSSVRMQQGRVQLDADWNESEDIWLYRTRTEAEDTLGGAAMPIDAPGYGITFSGGQFRIAAGRAYVDGILVENDTEDSYTNQPDFPGQTLPAGNKLFFFLDVYERHITGVEDSDLLDVALNGLDTATRLRVLGRVWAIALPNNVNTCAQAFSRVPGPTAARLRARAKTLDVTEACTVRPGSQYRRLENQLYRVEVHTGGTLNQARFKWSRDNGSILSAANIVDVRIVQVSQPGRDQMLSFAAGQWIEITDTARDLKLESGEFFKIARVEDDRLILDPNAPGVTAANYGAGLKVRRWDSAGPVAFGNLDPDGFMSLEDGVQVRISGADFRVGDHWLIPARTATGDVIWPTTGGVPDDQEPLGIIHHYAPLAIAVQSPGANAWQITDCRRPFIPLTDVIDMHFLAGDGQEVMPNPTTPNAMLQLPQLPTVGVTRGRRPVQNAQVRFTVIAGNGQINSANPASTNAQGIATCDWRVDSTTAVQKLKAELLDENGAVIHVPVTFTVQLSRADLVSYNPTCDRLTGKLTVQAALDELCNTPVVEECCIVVHPGKHKENLVAVLKRLIEDTKIEAACLCLKPGIHTWIKGVLDIGDRKPRLSLKLHGVRGGTTIQANGVIDIRGFGSLDIRDIAFQANGQAYAINIEDCAELNMEGCRIEGTAEVTTRVIPPPSPTVGPTQMVVCGTILRIGAVTDLTLTDNIVRGQIVVPQTPGDFRDPIERGDWLVPKLWTDIATVGESGPRTKAFQSVVKEMSKATPEERKTMAVELERFIGRPGMVDANTVNLTKNLILALRQDTVEAAVLTRAVQALAPRVATLGGTKEVMPPVALQLDDVDGFHRIERNVFLGWVALYAETGAQQLSGQIWELLQARMKRIQGNEHRNWGSARLIFSDNVLGGFRLPAMLANGNDPAVLAFIRQNGLPPFPIYQDANLQGNEMAFGLREFMAVYTAITSNIFSGQVQFQGVLFGRGATATGNIAEQPSNIGGFTQLQPASAGNLQVTI
ncbi:MAG: hypothetical protein KF784_00390 [Fimbriimonadaceae bacterium]|nr:hypothetical protein [Fimbriimonadaceae bacterium]